MSEKDLNSKIKNFPTKTGVYIFKDVRNQVIYIGKALNLKKRVADHFRKKLPTQEIDKVIYLVRKIDFEVTNSEIESLLLEAQLIKKYRPKYNICLKDGRRYLYVGITREKFPLVRLLRQPEKEKKLLVWYGPFPSSQTLKEILRLVRRIFTYRSCRKLPNKPCLYYHLKLCPAPCIKPSTDYLKNIFFLRLFLNGQISLLTADLRKKMKISADNLKFEEASMYKSQIQMMESLLQRPMRQSEEGKAQKQLLDLKNILIRWQGTDPVIIHRLEAYDVANLGNQIIVGAMVVLINGEPANEHYRQFKVQKKFQDDPAALKEILLRRFKHPEWLYPQVVLVDGGKPQVSAAFSVLKENKLLDEIGLLGLAKKKETIVLPRIKNEEIVGWKLLNYSPNSAVLKLLRHARDEAHRFGRRYYQRLLLSQGLRLPAPGAD